MNVQLLLKTYFLTLLSLGGSNFNIFYKGKSSIYPQDGPHFSCASHIGCAEWADARQVDFGAALARELKASGTVGQDGKVRTLVLDAGHGGKDTGASSGRLKEKDIALSIVLKVGALIQASYPDVQIIYTRDTDVFVPLDERAEIANRNNADLFISVHCNALPPSPATHGTETYVLGLHRADDNLDIVKRENASILLEDNYEHTYRKYDPNSPEGHIFLSSFQHANLEQSINIASKVEGEFKGAYSRRSLGVKQAGFLVLRATTMPSILIETGFMTNRNESTYLGSNKGQTEVADALYKAFGAYKTEMEGLAPDAPQVEATSVQNVLAQPVGLAASDVVFKVQLASALGPIRTDVGLWTKLNSFDIERYDRYFKYVVGPFDGYEEAVEQQNFLRGLGFKEAYVVAYNKNQRIDLDAALRLLGMR